MEFKAQEFNFNSFYQDLHRIKENQMGLISDSGFATY